MSSVTLDEIVFDDSIYPRVAWSQATVDRYTDALHADEHFPAIILEAGTRRLLDGKHRVEAHRAAGRHFIAADFHEIPDGIPAVLYAASLSARHGDPLAVEDKRTVARKIAEASPDYSMVLIAQLLGTTRQTISSYVADIVEHRRELRKAKTALLSRAGKSVREIAEMVGVGKSQVSDDVKEPDITGQLAEDVLREAAKDLPFDADPIVEAILAERAVPKPAETPGPVESRSTALTGPGSTSPEPEPEPKPNLRIVPPPGSPATWTAEQVEANRADVETRRMRESARRHARTFVTTILTEISTVTAGVELGERGLVTAEMVAQIREAVGFLARFVEVPE